MKLMLCILKSVQNHARQLPLSSPTSCMAVITNWIFNYQHSQLCYKFSFLRTPGYNTALPSITKAGMNNKNRARIFPQRNNNFHSLKSSRISRIRRCAGAFGFGVPLALTAQFLFSGGTRHAAGREKIGHRCG